MLDGTPCRIEMEDYGDTVPAFDAHGNPFSAYTTRFSVTQELVFYSIIDKDVYTGENQRQAEDWAHLEDYVDMKTLKLIKETN